MADYPTAPSTFPEQCPPENIANSTEDPVVRIAPHKQAKDHAVLQIRTKISSTLPSTTSSHHQHHHVHSGRVTKPLSILRSSTNLKPKEHSNLHVRFEDQPRRARSMAPSPETPPRTPPPPPPSFEEDTTLKNPPLTPRLMPQPSIPPPAPHKCNAKNGRGCHKCARIMWKNNRSRRLALLQRSSDSEVLENRMRCARIMSENNRSATLAFRQKPPPPSSSLPSVAKESSDSEAWDMGMISPLGLSTE